MSKNVTEYALSMLRTLPRVCLANLRDNPGAYKGNKRGRGQHGGDKHGAGNKGSGQRQNYMRLGYETGNNPFYLRFPIERYYKGHHLRRQYPPISLLTLQKLIDTDRVDASKPIDLTTLCNTGLMTLYPDQRQCGFHLTDEGADIFKAKVNIEVQWASEPVIAAVERNGGVITVSYYDMTSLFAAVNPKKFFRKGVPIPRRMLPHTDELALHYTNPSSRGYLADPEKVSWERFVLAQKYGYTLPRIEDDPNYEMLCERKDPRQIFYGLEPGWIVDVHDKIIFKPKDPELEAYYKS